MEKRLAGGATRRARGARSSRESVSVNAENAACYQTDVLGSGSRIIGDLEPHTSDLETSPAVQAVPTALPV